MKNSSVLILGCGYTGRRVARRLLERGIRVVATSRSVAGLEDVAAAKAEVVRMDVLEPETLDSLRQEISGEELRVLHSVPTIQLDEERFDPTPRLLQLFDAAAARIVYLSTTGVYGAAFEVDETTAPAPTGESGRLRVKAEREVQRGAGSALVLRPAAIYGPGRGVHERMRRGRYTLVEEGSNTISRIHVDDLAALTEAALLSELTGAYPVADREPCTSREMARYCADLMGLSMPPSEPRSGAHHTRIANRRVDGSAIFRLLNVELRYPSYRSGVPASLQEAVR